MPETEKALDETGAWQYWLLFGCSWVITAIAVEKILARFLSPTAWQLVGKFLAVWLLLLIVLALMFRFFV